MAYFEKKRTEGKSIGNEKVSRLKKTNDSFHIIRRKRGKRGSCGGKGKISLKRRKRERWNRP